MKLFRQFPTLKASRILASHFHQTATNFAVVVVNVPSLGESISEGSIASWGKSVGSPVAIDDVIAVIETDKVTVDIKSPFSGTIVELLGEPSSTVSVLFFLERFDFSR
jgi:2-oxoglutarate dehydrogenase E2 component (dihydrolipoamide succinyltransferase)